MFYFRAGDWGREAETTMQHLLKPRYITVKPL